MASYNLMQNINEIEELVKVNLAKLARIRTKICKEDCFKIDKQ